MLHLNVHCYKTSTTYQADVSTCWQADIVRPVSPVFQNHYMQKLLSPRSRVEYDEFNRFHFGQLAQHGRNKRAVTPKVRIAMLLVFPYESRFTSTSVHAYLLYSSCRVAGGRYILVLVLDIPATLPSMSMRKLSMMWVVSVLCFVILLLLYHLACAAGLGWSRSPQQ